MQKLEDISNYGELIAYAVDGFLWSYKEYGSYQGDYVAIVEKIDNNILIYKGNYGSCGGCDFLQGQSDENGLSEESIIEYMKDLRVFLVIPKSCLPDSLEAFIELLPANTRTVYEDKVDNEDYYEEPSLKDIYNQMKKETHIDNLKWLEWKNEQRD